MYMALFTTNYHNYNHNFASDHEPSLFSLYEQHCTVRKASRSSRVNRPFSMHAYIRAYFVLECKAMSLCAAGVIPRQASSALTQT